MNIVANGASAFDLLIPWFISNPFFPHMFLFPVLVEINPKTIIFFFYLFR